MLQSLPATLKELRELREKLRSNIHGALELPKQDFVDFVPSAVPGGREVAYQLVCAQHGESARDNKGADLPVLEVASGRGWRALLGISVTWAKDTQTRYRFIGCQLILFLDASSRSDIPLAKQVMRLEWEALDLNNNFDSEIAHPHWQMDLANFATVKSDQPVPAFASTSGAEPNDTPVLESFAALPTSPDLTWSSKLHLAASAQWMNRAWSEVRPVPHVSGPQDIDELISWMISSCRYVRWQVEEAFAD